MAFPLNSVPPPKHTDQWEIRCRFNRAHYNERSKTGEFRVERHNTPIDPKRGLAYAFSQEWYYYDRATGDQLAHGHVYLYEDMTFGGSRLPDPKAVFVGGVRYHLYRDKDGISRDLSLELPRPLGWAYKVWRRIKCFLLGR